MRSSRRSIRCTTRTVCSTTSPKPDERPPIEHEEAAEPDRERFAQRLESFVDVVFGLSLSLSATRLPSLGGTQPFFADSTALTGFVVTFAAIVVVWLFAHRTLSLAYVQSRLSTAAVFVMLIGVVLLPNALAMFLTKSVPKNNVYRAYDADFFAIMGGLACISWHGFFCRFRRWPLARRARVWRIALRQGGVAGFVAAHGLLLPRLADAAPFAYFALFLISLTRFVPMPRAFRGRSAASPEDRQPAHGV